MRKLIVLVSLLALMFTAPMAQAGCLLDCTEPPELPGGDGSDPDDDDESDPADGDGGEGEDSGEDPGAEPADPQPQAGEVPEAAKRLLALVNDERSRNGLRPVTERSDVTAIALDHSWAQADKRTIWHNDAYFSKTTKARLGAKTVGENVAMNSSIDDAHRRLMASSGHRANILSPAFSVIGIGVVRAPDGVLYITQNFLQPVSGGAAAADAGRTGAGSPAVSGGSTVEPKAAPAELGAGASAAAVTSSGAVPATRVRGLRLERTDESTKRVDHPAGPALPGGLVVVAILALCLAGARLARRLPVTRSSRIRLAVHA